MLKYIPQKHHSHHSPFDAHIEISKNDQTSTDYNIIKLIKVIEHDDDYYALLPYAEIFLDATIHILKKLSISNAAESAQLKTPLAIHVLHDLCDAFISLHLDKNYMHGDVKPANVCYYRGHWCLIDMDCAKKIGEPVEKFSGTLAYSHPSAIYRRDNVSHPSNDLYALGEMIFAILQKNDTELHDGEIVRMKDALYKQALIEKSESSLEFIPFLEAINQCVSLEEKLMVIAHYLTQPLASHQPNLLEVKECINTLQIELFSTECFSQSEKTLEEFYEKISAGGYFMNDSSSSGRSPTHYPAKLSLFTDQLNSSLREIDSTNQNASLSSSPLSPKNREQTPDREQTSQIVAFEQY